MSGARRRSSSESSVSLTRGQRSFDDHGEAQDALIQPEIARASSDNILSIRLAEEDLKTSGCFSTIPGIYGERCFSESTVAPDDISEGETSEGPPSPLSSMSSEILDLDDQQPEDEKSNQTSVDEKQHFEIASKLVQKCSTNDVSPVPPSDLLEGVQKGVKRSSSDPLVQKGVTHGVSPVPPSDPLRYYVRPISTIPTATLASCNSWDINDVKAYLTVVQSITSDVGAVDNPWTKVIKKFKSYFTLEPQAIAQKFKEFEKDFQASKRCPCFEQALCVFVYTLFESGIQKKKGIRKP
jgi:hypothetical protein